MIYDGDCGVCKTLLALLLRADLPVATHQILVAKLSETLAGFVLAQLQKIPTVGDSFEFDGRRFTVASMDGLRVDTVRIDVSEPQEQKHDSPATPMAS